MKKLTLNILAIFGIFAFATPALLSSCSDEPDAENYYTFTGKMMSEYIKTNSDYSQFAKIVERAGLMDLLSAYGHYTCFAPTNEAVNAYLSKKGVSLESLSVADCDTIARTHLVNDIYMVSDMPDGVLPTQNMMRRNLQIEHSQDANQNAVIVVNGNSTVFFEHQDDSVENGVVQPVNRVIENSTKSVPSIIAQDESCQIFGSALRETKLDIKMEKYKDLSYNYKDYEDQWNYYQYKSGSCPLEDAIVPKEKLYGFTAFVVPDDILKKKYPRYFMSGKSYVEGLYELACWVYDYMYTDEEKASDFYKFENISDERNPLYRFMAYHILDRNVQGYNMLTVLGDANIDKATVNPTDWYTTMLPYSMIKVQHLTVGKWIGVTGVQGDYYINRNFDDSHRIEGIHVRQAGASQNANNGIYFYIDDILKFDEATINDVHNTRIRMDFSTIFPEIMTNSIRMNGGVSADPGDKGTNYSFPSGYLENVTLVGDSKLIYRYPRQGFYSMNGDEMIAREVFDITFNLPPVPFSGDWQVRLGFSPMNPNDGADGRGQVQIYIDGKSQGIPLNFEERIDENTIYGSTSFPSYLSIRDDNEKRQEDFKILKNKGYYRGPFSVSNHSDGVYDKNNSFAGNSHTVRKVLATLYLDAKKTHTIRIKNVSKSFARKREAMLDYLELVPKSIYGVTDGANAEDDL